MTLTYSKEDLDKQYNTVIERLNDLEQLEEDKQSEIHNQQSAGAGPRHLTIREAYILYLTAWNNYEEYYHTYIRELEYILELERELQQPVQSKTEPTLWQKPKTDKPQPTNHNLQSTTHNQQVEHKKITSTN